MPDYPNSLHSAVSYTDGFDWPMAAHRNLIDAEVAAIEAELGTNPRASAATVKARLAQSLDALGNVDFAFATTLTISGGSITPVQNNHLVDTESAAASDDLDTIVASGISDGFLLVLQPVNSARDVTIKHNTGNILCPGGLDFTMADTNDWAILIYNTALAKWKVAKFAGIAVTTTDTQTLTNKRVTPRVTTIVSSATPTINTDSCDFVDITALAAAITSMTTNLSGTPTNGQRLVIRFKDNGTARAITWGASFEAIGVALPTTTVISKRLTVGFIYDTTAAKWGCVASAQE